MNRRDAALRLAEMDETFQRHLVDDKAVTRPDPAPKMSWPLMGDIVSHRMEVPEHLIQWRRAMGEDDPQLLRGPFRREPG